jgi:hypothetical protein
VNTPAPPQHVVLLVDIANVMGSRPDGWWRDRAGAATRLLNGLGPLNGTEVTLPAGPTARVTEIRAVLEGPPELPRVLRRYRCCAGTDGDTEIVEEALRLMASGKTPSPPTAGCAVVP